MDAFFASVEQRDRPELRGKPVVVGARPTERGVVAAASYEARAYGIRSAMPSSEAGRRCPHAVFVPPDGKRYREASRHVMCILDRYTPLVEQVSVDEAFLDVTGSRRLFGTGPEIARSIKDAVKTETGLTASIGVAPNKFLAKLASDLDKPDGLTVVPRERPAIMAFLAPLPVACIWGVGKITQDKLHRAGLRTIGDLQQAPLERLTAVVGAHGAQHLLRLAHGEDAREIVLDRTEKSLSREYTFPRDCTAPERVARVLADLVEDVGRRLRRDGRYARLATLKLRWKGFETVTRQRRFSEPVQDDASLLAMARSLLSAQPLDRPVRLVGFGVADLQRQGDRQLSLFPVDNDARDRRERLSRAVDEIREKLGDESVRRGASDAPPPS